MSKWQFTKGLHDLGRGAYAYLQPSGTWGYSNAGLITDGDQSLLVDTLFDERLTAEMLGVMQDATGFGADRIGVVVNTHSNGDHTFGNRLAINAQIIASEAAAHEMREEGNPQMLAQLMKNTAAMGEVGAFFKRIFGAFDFAGVTFRLPDRTFAGEETLKVGDKQVKLIQVGTGAHSGRRDRLCPCESGRLHGRYSVHRWDSDRMGGSREQLDQSLRPNFGPGSRRGCPRPWPDHRQGWRQAYAGLSGLHRPGSTQTSCRGNEFMGCCTEYRSGLIRRLGRCGAAGSNGGYDFSRDK